jgi:hypothetical protein
VQAILRGGAGFSLYLLNKALCSWWVSIGDLLHWLNYSSLPITFPCFESRGVKIFKCSRPEYSQKIARWTLNTNQSIIRSNIPAAPAYGVYISQLIRYYRACGSYQDFLDRGLLLTRKLLNQGFFLVKLKSSLWTFYGRHHDLIHRYGISVSQMTHGYVPLDVSTSQSFPLAWLVTGFVTRITDGCN